MTTTSSVSHHLGRETAHHTWNRDEPPAIRVAPGEEIHLELRDGSNGQITAATTPADLFDLELAKMDPLTGPIWVETADPGDVLAVDILTVDLAPVGWSAIIPGLGLLSDRFPGPYLRMWDTTGEAVEIAAGHRFAVRPMLGVVGVAPAAPGDHASTVPTAAGGNIDVKFVTTGSRLLLPVFAEGALLSLGDPHALQGDGELSGTAIECQADAVVRVEVLKGAALDAPVVDTVPGAEATEAYRSFLGVGPDLFTAAQEASLRAVDGLATALGLEPHEAYALLGTIAELRIHEVVDRPNWVVGCMVPRRLCR